MGVAHDPPPIPRREAAEVECQQHKTYILNGGEKYVFICTVCITRAASEFKKKRLILKMHSNKIIWGALLTLRGSDVHENKILAYQPPGIKNKVKKKSKNKSKKRTAEFRPFRPHFCTSKSKKKISYHPAARNMARK